MVRNDNIRRAWCVGAAVAMGALGLAACAPVTALNSVTVTTTVDGPDLDPGDGVCEMTSGAGDCSLRAAVDEANADDEITYAIVPLGTYELDGGADEDANLTGDLDVAPASGLLTFLAPRGTVVDAGGAAGALDARSGLVFVNGISATGSSAAGMTARAGASLWLFWGSPHGNAGAGLAYEAGAKGDVRNSTVSGNGSGIDNAGSIVLGFVTVTANDGPGLTGSGSTAVTGSIVADQTGGADCSTPVTSLGWNAFGESGCGVGPDDTLGPTLALTPELVDGVPGFVPAAGATDVRDAIPAGQAPCQSGLLAIDQHGVDRPVGDGCDKGALETEAPSAAFVVDTEVDAVDEAPGDGVCDDGAGACTLRAAIQEAVGVSGTQSVLITIAPGIDPVLAPEFGPSGIVDAMTVTGDVTIDGDGATVHMSNRETVFAIGAGHATFRDITLTGASSTSGFLGSTGTDPARSLTLDHATLTANEWSAVRFGGESLTIVDSTITGTENTAVSASVVDLVVERSNLLGNKDHMIATATRATIVDSTYEGSQISLWLTTTESTRIERSTFAQGDGLRLAGPDTLVTNSTVSGGSSFGIQVTSGSAEIVGTTVSDLFFAAVGSSGSAQVTVRGSALLGYDHTCFEEGTSSITSGGYNVVEGTSCGFAATGDVQGVASLGIGALADNGGPTRTRLPATTSPLVDAVPVGTPGLCDATTPTDQRGVPRPQGAACDIGSVEISGLVVDTAADGFDVAPGDGTCDDGSGACTLRAAIQEANTQSGGVREVITIAPGVDPVVAPAFGPGAIVEPLAIAGGLIVDGGGATISSSFRNQLFTVDQLDTTFRDLTVSVTGVDGVIITTSTPDPDRSVTLDGVDIVFTDSSPSNSGIFAQGAALTVLDSTIDALGGRALQAAVTDLVIDRSTVWGKDAVVAEDSGAARITVRESTIRGGDLDLYVTATESILVERSTVMNSYYGASLGAPLVTVRSSTFTGSYGGPGLGGASSTVDISASTFTSFGYAGVWLSGTSITVRGTVVSGAFDAGACQIAAGSTLVSGGYNSSSDATCGFTGTGDVQNVVSAFGALADNGGPTLTMLPAAGSPLIGAIPAGTPGLCDYSWVTRDQRGVERPQGAGCDIGSVEQ